MSRSALEIVLLTLHPGYKADSVAPRLQPRQSSPELNTVGNCNIIQMALMYVNISKHGKGVVTTVNYMNFSGSL